MFPLPHKCYTSGTGPCIHPKNWMNKNASIKGRWYISYWFYDPSVPGKKQVLTKGGVNEFKTLQERQRAIQSLLEAELELLQQGYNPIKNAIVPVETTAPGDISENTPFIEALKFALSRKDCEKTTKADITSVLKYFEQSAIQLGKSRAPIMDIKRKDIRLILDNCKNVALIRKDKSTAKKTWNNNQFNHYRKYISALYAELEELEVVEYNPVEKIAKRDTVQKIREVLTAGDRRRIHEYLATANPAFLRFINIFFHSGSRRSEIFKLQGKDVDLSGQQFKTTVRKGKNRREVWKTIKDVALQYWAEQMSTCRPDDYVFSVGFLPAARRVLPEYATKKWNRLIKQPLGITADLYSLKHLHTSEIIDYLEDTGAAKIAADHNSHTSTAMVVNIYDVRHKQRERDKLKGIKNSFV